MIEITKVIKLRKKEYIMNWLKFLTRKVFPVTDDEMEYLFSTIPNTRSNYVERLVNKFIHKKLMELSGRQKVIISTEGILIKNGYNTLDWHNDIPSICFGEYNKYFRYDLIPKVIVEQWLADAIQAKDGELLLKDFVMLRGLSDNDLKKSEEGLRKVLHEILDSAVSEFQSRLSSFKDGEY